MIKTKTLSLCMIVKNEEDYLEQCLNSVKDIVDEIIIVDTGSTDSTIEIAEKFGAKIYHFEWVNDFSKARNFSIEKATGEWLLLLDADEVLEAKDRDKLIEFMNNATQDGCNFRVYNYIGEEVSDQVSVHYAFRLLRNNHRYTFEGAIHEQISPIDKKYDLQNFTSADIIIYHYGYLDKITIKKDKRSRNLPMILKELEKNPNDAYHLFNLGNEYLGLKDFKKAIENYEKALVFVEDNRPITPHIYFRLVQALLIIEEYERALEVVEQAISIYPNYTDIWFSKGLIHKNLYQYTLAISSFNKCLMLGEPPFHLKMIEGCSTYRPYLALGEIFQIFEDYPQALEVYKRAILSNPNLVNYLYTIGEILNKMYSNKQVVTEELKKCFVNLDTANNLVAFIAILLEQQLYKETVPLIKELELKAPDAVDTIFIIAKYHFFTKQYNLAYNMFKNLITKPIVKTILPNIREDSIKFSFIISLLKPKEELGNPLELIKQLNNPIIEKVYLQLNALYNSEEKEYLQNQKEWSGYLKYIISYLEQILRVKEEKLFEASIPIVEYIYCEETLVELSKLYAHYNYKEKSVEMILQCIHKFKKVNRRNIFMLFQQL